MCVPMRVYKIKFYVLERVVGVFWLGINVSNVDMSLKVLWPLSTWPDDTLLYELNTPVKNDKLHITTSTKKMDITRSPTFKKKYLIFLCETDIQKYIWQPLSEILEI